MRSRGSCCLRLLRAHAAVVARRWDQPATDQSSAGRSHIPGVVLGAATRRSDLLVEQRIIVRRLSRGVVHRKRSYDPCPATGQGRRISGRLLLDHAVVLRPPVAVAMTPAWMTSPNGALIRARSASCQWPVL